MNGLRQLAVWTLSIVVMTLPKTIFADDDLRVGNIGAGAKVIVKSQITIPANEEAVYFQNGVLVSRWSNINEDEPSCRLLVVPNSVVRILMVGREFVVTKARSGNSKTSYEAGLAFKADPTVDQLQCSVGKNGGGYMTIGQLKIQLGQLFDLAEAPPIKG